MSRPIGTPVPPASPMMPMPLVMSSARLFDSMSSTTSMKLSSDDPSSGVEAEALRRTVTLLRSICCPLSALSIAAESFPGKMPTTNPCDTRVLLTAALTLTLGRADGVTQTFDAGADLLFRRIGKVQAHAVVHGAVRIETHPGHENHFLLRANSE